MQGGEPIYICKCVCMSPRDSRCSIYIRSNKVVIRTVERFLCTGFNHEVWTISKKSNQDVEVDQKRTGDESS